MSNTIHHYFSNFIVWYLVFLFSTTFHEAMHSFVSHYGGDATASSGGQASLNPIPHIRRSPFGMVIVPILTFILAGGSFLIGWASAPFNPFWAARYPKRAVLMSLAGPLSHLPLIAISFLGMVIGLQTGFFQIGFDDPSMIPLSTGSTGGLAWALAKLLSVAFNLNVILFLFNLIPLPPMDGSEIWYLFAKSEHDRLNLRATMHQYSFVGMLLAWYIFPRIYGPVYVSLIHLILRIGYTPATSG